jgi:hypothetical protein
MFGPATRGIHVLDRVQQGRAWSVGTGSIGSAGPDTAAKILRLSWNSLCRVDQRLGRHADQFTRGLVEIDDEDNYDGDVDGHDQGGDTPSGHGGPGMDSGDLRSRWLCLDRRGLFIKVWRAACRQGVAAGAGRPAFHRNRPSGGAKSLQEITEALKVRGAGPHQVVAVGIQ